MKIKEVHVDGFGVWSGLRLEQFSDRMTVVYGPNEAGKTTLMQFVRSVLYGVDQQRRERYLPPVYGGTSGGRMHVSAQGECFDVTRWSHGKSTRQLSWQDEAGIRCEAPAWFARLGQLDEAAFNNVFCLGLRELQELATLDEAQVGDQLYELTTGLDRVSLGEVLRNLRGEQGAIWTDDKATTRVGQLLSRHQPLAEQVAAGESSGRRWLRLQQRQREIDLERQQLTGEADRINEQGRLLEAAAQVAAPWRRREQLAAKLKSLGPREQISTNWLRMWQRIEQACQQRRERCAELKDRGRRIKQQALEIPRNIDLWDQASQIDSLAQYLPWLGSLDGQIQRLENDVQRLDAARRSAEQQVVDVPEPVNTPSPPSAPAVAPAVMEDLRVPARRVREATTRLEQARQQLRASKEASLVIQSEPRRAGAPDPDELNTALQDTGERVGKLRRRVQLEERVDKMLRHRAELQEESRELLEHQVLPPQTLMWLGIPFVIGLMLILGGIFWSTASKLGWPVALLGLVGWGVAIGMKIMLERSAAADLEECNEQLEALQKQLRIARRERDELDEELPAGGGPLDQRLAKAEQELQELETWVPQDARRDATQQRHSLAEEESREAAQELSEARQCWRSALARHGLSTDLTPRDVKAMAARQPAAPPAASVAAPAFAGIDQHLLDSRRDELAARRQEREGLQVRLLQLAGVARVEAAGRSPLELIYELQSAAQEERRLHQRYQQLVKKYNQTRRRYGALNKQLKQLRRRRVRLLQAAGVRTPDDLAQLATQHAEWLDVSNEHDELTRKIQQVAGSYAAAPALAELMERHANDELEQAWEQVSTQLQDLQDRQAVAHERLGEIRQELKTLAADRQADQARLEQATVEQALRSAVQRWQVVTACRLGLEHVRAEYEQHRQPWTLQRASSYLQQLTDGHYVRVWTPLDQTSLRVDNLEGQTLTMAKLSTGAREAVFLCLRLALVAQFADRGIQLPLVLDDVLVNLDQRRCTAAIGLLKRFAAEGHQVLLFTCHAHVVRLSRQAEVEVRGLPDHQALGREQRLLLAEVDDEIELNDKDMLPEPVTVTPVMVTPVMVEPVAVEPLVASAATPQPAEYVAADDESYEDDDTQVVYDEDEYDEQEEEYEEDEYDAGEQDESEEDEYEEDEYEEDEYEEDEEEDEEAYAEWEEDDAAEELDEWEEDEADEEEPAHAESQTEQEQPVVSEPLAEEAEPGHRALDVALSEELEAPPLSPGDQNDRFTWDSPERWWERDQGDAA